MTGIRMRIAVIQPAYDLVQSVFCRLCLLLRLTILNLIILFSVFQLVQSDHDRMRNRLHHVQERPAGADPCLLALQKFICFFDTAEKIQFLSGARHCDIQDADILFIFFLPVLMNDQAPGQCGFLQPVFRILQAQP